MALISSHISKISLSVLLASLICVGGFHYVEEISERTERSEAQREVILTSAHLKSENLVEDTSQKTFRPKKILLDYASLRTVFSGSDKYNIKFIYYTSYLDSFIF